MMMMMMMMMMMTIVNSGGHRTCRGATGRRWLRPARSSTDPKAAIAAPAAGVC
jgi:hypothetical protein